MSIGSIRLRGAAVRPLSAPREREVLRLLATGASNARIATQLGLSINTVKTYLRQIALALGARNRTEAALRARDVLPAG